MALGKQFENTYWEEPDGSVGLSLVRSTPMSGGAPLTRASAKPMQHADISIVDPDVVPAQLDEIFGSKPEVPFSHRDGQFFASKPRQDEEPTPALQGLLFSPHTATGTGRDPLVVPDDRAVAARRALRMEDTPEAQEAYINQVAYTLHEKVGSKAASTHQQLAVDALLRSGMPISEMEAMGDMGTAATIVKPSKGRAFFDSGSGDSGLIVLNRGVVKRRAVQHVPESVKVTTTQGDHLPNPKFWDWHDRVAPGSGSSAFIEDLIDTIGDADSPVVWSHPETGEVLPKNVEELNSHPLFKGMKTRSRFSETGFAEDGPFVELNFRGSRQRTGLKNVHADEVVDLLRGAGFVANIYGGTAKTLKTPTHTTGIQLTGDIGYRDYKTISAHTRHAPGTVSEEVIPASTRPVTVSEPVISGGSTTLVHEMGHAKDAERLRGGDRSYHLGILPHYDKRGMLTGRYGYADPIAEGVADGYADMYARGNNLLESAIADPVFAPTHHTNTGYSTEYSNFKTNTHKAIYSAIRAHIGQGGSFDDIPNREDIAYDPTLNISERRRNALIGYKGNNEDVEKSHVIHEATLGHIWDTMPHVRGHLAALGYDRIAIKAAEENQKHREQWTRDNVGEQLSFDDL